jgi:hypothetical protein
MMLEFLHVSRMIFKLVSRFLSLLRPHLSHNRLDIPRHRALKRIHPPIVT